MRIDRVTDGRHAEVEFTRDWQLDANRRDLTVNSMFLGFDGSIYDYFDGQKDLAARRLRFVGDAAGRITEDYLRILRYFRFFGRLAPEGASHEECTLSAIATHAEGLQGIAGERLWLEMRKVLDGPQAPSILAVMTRCGVLPFCGLPEQPSLSELECVWSRSRAAPTHPAANLAALLSHRAQLDAAHERMKFSNLDLSIASFLLEHRSAAEQVFFEGGETAIMRHCQELFLMHREMANMNIKTLQLARYLGCSHAATALEVWQSMAPHLPVNGRRLMQLWNVKGREVGLILKLLRERWRQMDFEATEEQLTCEDVRLEVMPEVEKLLHNQKSLSDSEPPAKVKPTAK